MIPATKATPEVPQPVWDYLSEACFPAFNAAAREVAPLQGDASARKYFRVELQPGAEVGKTVILMQFPAGLKPLGSEEATEGKCPIEELPFVNVRKFLERRGVRVPHIFDVRQNLGFLLLEDLGDFHLLDAITQDRKKGLALFGKAISQMALMHEKAGRPDGGEDCTAFYQRMSERLYAWEFEHFLEYGYAARLGYAVEKTGELPHVAEARKIFAGISKELARLPAVFTHRDFHSQNIIVKDGEVVLIDFQDALLAPSVYDLASLLRDRYFGLTEGEVGAFLRQYLSERPGCREARMAFGDFRRLFDLQVLQRNMKAAGRFVFLDKVKGKPHLLPHLPNLFKSMKNVIAQRAELAPLLPLVEKAERGG